MHSKSDNIEVITYDNANEIVKEMFESFLSRYQTALETSKKGSYFNFDGVNLPYYKCRKAKFKRNGSYIESPD